MRLSNLFRQKVFVLLLMFVVTPVPGAGAQTATLPSREEQVEEMMAQADDGELPITTLPGFQEVMTCAGKPEDSECWMELENQPGCYIWNNSLGVNESATWSGGCVNGLAEGMGEIIWAWESDGVQVTITGTGQVKGGKQYGQWIIRHPRGTIMEGKISEGPYVDGKRHGQWVIRWADGDVAKGPYVDGKEHGHWAIRYAFGGVHEGPYLDGKQHGQWVTRYADGDVEEGPYVDGERHGRWVFRYADGNVGGGSYVDGKKHGHWVVLILDDVYEGPYVGGDRHGHWVIRDPLGNVAEGPYVDDKRHGQWIVRHPDGVVSKETYVNGLRQ